MIRRLANEQKPEPVHDEAIDVRRESGGVLVGVVSKTVNAFAIPCEQANKQISAKPKSVTHSKRRNSTQRTVFGLFPERNSSPRCRSGSDESTASYWRFECPSSQHTCLIRGKNKRDSMQVWAGEQARRKNS
jgi:hypothetical protein